MKYFFYLLIFLLPASITAQTERPLTRQDTLRGSDGTFRTWWDVQRYDLAVQVDIDNKSIKGKNTIRFKVNKSGKPRRLQLDLQMPMSIDKIEYVQFKYGALPFQREGNVYWVDLGERVFEKDSEHSIVVHFSGTPRAAIRAPWDGGWVWAKDSLDRPWITVACQGLGASVWYPCKDYQGDEPNKGASLAITVPDSLTAIGNGRLIKKTSANGNHTWTWEVNSPINNYNIIPYIGYYANWEEKLKSLNGPLDASYWVLDYNLERAKAHFKRDVQRMFDSFEDWFGPYPFFNDGYKLVETSHLGMEHQSAVAYGNKYTDGYLGNDLSGSGWGMKWDYIIIHETGHEWFANNVSTIDIADMWVHEGFTSYSEVLFVESNFGKKAADEYNKGSRKRIGNKEPIIGKYGVNRRGSGDMYPKGMNLLHTIRQIIDNDIQFKKILRGLNQTFYHQTITSADVEAYIIKQSGKNLAPIFDQYLRQANIPVLEYSLKEVAGNPNQYSLKMRWADVVDGFAMPVKVTVQGKDKWIYPTTEWKTIKLAGKKPAVLPVNENFYIETKAITE